MNSIMVESSPNGYKTLWEKEKLLVTSNFSFSHSVFKRLVMQTRKNQGLFGKGLRANSIHNQLYGWKILLFCFCMLNEYVGKHWRTKNESVHRFVYVFFSSPPPQKKIRNYWNGFQEMVSKKLFIEQNFTENFGARIFGKPICL